KLFVLSLIKDGNQRSSVAVRAPAFHPLRKPFLYPGGRPPGGFLKDKTMRELVAQGTRQLVGDGFKSLHRYADFSVVERPRPTGRTRDVAKGLLGIQNHGDRLWRRVAQLVAKRLKLIFQDACDFGCERARRAAVIAYDEVRRPAFSEIAFDLLIVLHLFEHSGHAGGRREALCGLKIRDGLVRLI